MSSHVQSHMARAAWRFLDGTIVFEVHQDAFGKFKKKKKKEYKCLELSFIFQPLFSELYC